MNQTVKFALTADLKMAEIILNNPYLLLLNEHFGINAPFQEKSVYTVCKENGLSTDLFLTFANLYNGIHYSPDEPPSFNDIMSIIGFLKNSHKFYSEEIYPELLSTIRLMAKVNDYREMTLVQKFFIDYFNEVTEHLDYEDKVVFPYVLTLYGQIMENKHPEPGVEYSVQEYKEHHNDIEEKLNDLKNLLIKYLPQKSDFAIRRKLLFDLSELEYDLVIHARIEDLILIPLVARMESHLKETR
jgi:regulator of cell morphogenesis and NO signaling